MREEEKRLAEELLFSEGKKPSFSKRLFFGDFDAEQVLPFPGPKEEAQKVESFLEKVKAFAKEKIDPDQIDREAKIPDSVIQGLADLGVLGMTVPKEYGGLGMSQYTYCRVVEEIARRCGSTALFINVHQSIGLKTILLFGTPEQKKQWLPPLARGEIFTAFALTEPNAGSDANGIETRAVFDPEKKVYRINGEKQWITNGSIAHVLTVMAKTEVETPRGREDKVTAFLVTPDMPGFAVKDRSLEKVGTRGTWTANLTFNNLEVPEQNILGPMGGGLKVCLTVLDYGRTTFGAMCTGAAKELVERAVDHSINRHQFQRPLASFALVKKKIAVMSALAYAMEATTYLTAGFVDDGAEDFMLESAMLKVFNSDGLWQILYDTMQILGGRSFFTDQPYERMMRDARLNMIGEGSNEVLRAFIGVVGMRDVGMELKEGIDALKSFADFGKVVELGGSLVKRMGRPKVPVHSQQLKKEVAMLEKAIREFSWMVVRLLSRYGEDIVERQLQLNRISSIAMALYTTTAVLSKLDTDLEKVGGRSEALGNDVAVGKFYCHQAMTMIRRLLIAINRNPDEEIENLSDQITGIRTQ
ncbi:MAG: putative acyl-CoA dehydrogenase FadE10 [Chlamydiae bacterium]|nr:putative acyl-CoA dehydrogenase FadE10 [Chlamydiota bacterium]